MSEKEVDARNMAEKIKKLPPQIQERIGYIIEGAALVHSGNNNAAEAGKDTRPSA